MSNESLAPELWWLGWTCLLAAVFWVPYVLNRIMVRGLMPALGYAEPDAPRHADWAERMMGAHKNLTEGLVVFGPVVIALVVTELTTTGTATAAMIYFWARVAHMIVTTFGIPIARTLSFAAGAFANIYLVLALLGIA